MGTTIFIGDEVTGAGFALAGAELRAPEAAATLAAFDEATAGADLVLLTAAAAARLPEAGLAARIARGRPLIAVVPDLVGGAAPPNLGARVYAALGVET